MISFPLWTDLSGATTEPPQGAPLGQQVVFTFSGVPEGPERVQIDQPAVYDALQIYALLDEDYAGPEDVVDRDRGIIPARGVFERIGNLVVYTPYFPTEPVDFGLNASRFAVPGLLPDMEYVVYVPIGLGGSIRNLVSKSASVLNPVRFTTCSEDLQNLFFSNHPSVPPGVVGHYPGDGETGVAINWRGSKTGYPGWQEFWVEFDQPLQSSGENVTGDDLDGDGVAEENMLYAYASPEGYAALDAGTSRDPAILKLNRREGTFEDLGVTRTVSGVVGLRSIAVDGGGVMLGSNGTTLYKVDYQQEVSPPGACGLLNAKTLAGRSNVRGLCFHPDGRLLAVDGDTNELIEVDRESGANAALFDLGASAGAATDAAVRLDGAVYVVSVRESGQPSAWSTVQAVLVDEDPVESRVVWSGAGDLTSLALMGYSRLALYSGNGLGVRVLDSETGQELLEEAWTLSGLDDDSPLDMESWVSELGTDADLVTNTFEGSRVVLAPSGILPFGERVEFLIRHDLENISFGSLAANEGRNAASADLIASFTTFDPGDAVVADEFYEEFLDATWEGKARLEGLPPANWNVRDVDGEDPDYEHLLATYGLSGSGNLGDFKPLGVYPTVLLDTDYQPLPLFDGSTPGVRKPTVVTNGVFNFRDIIIPNGVTVRALGSNPLILTATGTVQIAGIIDCSGVKGSNDVTFNSAFTPVPGGIGGPGAGRGGMSNPAKPDNFRALSELRSPRGGEGGFGYSNLKQIGGGGGASGAKGADVPYGSSKEDPESRGAGGGGGSFYKSGSYGYHGLGMWGADPNDPARYFVRDQWYFDDGAPPSVPGDHRYWTQHPPGGAAGFWQFSDNDDSNDFIGAGGELKFLQGGQGGGGGGSRLDSMNPETIPLAASWVPPLDRSAYDAKGGGGGGGGGGLGIYALGEIVVAPTGWILARGGDGGGGEVIGHSNFGGGGGGGSGGAIILDSAEKITIRKSGPYKANIDVTGGWLGDAKEVVKYTSNAFDTNNCLNTLAKHRASFCCWADGDGGYGGRGLVQLQVPPPVSEHLQIDDSTSIYAELCIIDWTGPTGLCDGNPDNCACNPNTNSDNCQHKFYHFQVIRTGDVPRFPRTHEVAGESCLVPPGQTPTTLGPLSYGLSRWVDMGQVVHRDAVGGVPAPAFLGFTGIDTATGQVITLNGYVPNPENNDIEVFAPDWDGGTIHYIPERNDVSVEFQGANSLVPGSKVPDLDSYTAWTADIEALSGMQFIRFRVGLNTAANGYDLTPTSPKPQVNFVRIRMQY